MSGNTIGDNSSGKFLVVGPPRGGFTLLLSILNILYRSKNIRKDNLQESINYFIPMAADFVYDAIMNYFKEHLSLDDVFYSKEFAFLAGGPKWLDPEDHNTVCVRKYLGVKEKGDFIFIIYLPRFVLDYDEVVHSHSHPVLWTEDPYYKEYLKFASIRNPIDIVHSSVLSINALTSEYIQRCVRESEDFIREDLAMYKLTNLNFVEGLITYLLRYLNEFVQIRQKYHLMRWEDLLTNPIKTIKMVASDAQMEISNRYAYEIWRQIHHRNLTLYHKHSFRKGLLEDWKKRITNTHLEIFKEHGFDEFLEVFDYEKIKSFNERDYTPFQRKAQWYIKKGRVHKYTVDDNLFTFAFNKSNIVASKYNFKSYPRVGGIKVERSSFKDEDLLYGFMERVGKAVTIVSQFLNEIREMGQREQESDILHYGEFVKKYMELFSAEFSPQERERASLIFRDYRKKDFLPKVPYLIDTYKSYNVVKVEDRFYGVPHRLGPMDLSAVDPMSHPAILKADSLEDTRSAIRAKMKGKAFQPVHACASNSPFLKFYDPTVGGLESEISDLIRRGTRRFLLVPYNTTAESLVNKFDEIEEGVVFSCLKENELSSLSSKINQYDVVIFLEAEEPGNLSQWLLDCLDMTKGLVLAPLTEYHYTRRPLFVITIPRSGTHMLIGLLENMGINRSYSFYPQPGEWNTLDNYSYHAPCKEFMLREWSEEIGKHPFFRSPTIFMYRNPLDIICSEFWWYQRSSIGFSHYLRAFEDPDERLLCLIDDKLVLGSIRDRINRFLGWIDFSNVIPISYEELIGPKGGGSEAEQLRTIWSLQLKLHIPGSPIEIAEGIYNEASPTFHKGKIDQHRKIFKRMHYRRFGALPRDFMEKIGYGIHATGMPRFVEKFRRRPLQICRLTEKELWSQRLVKESFLGYNIVAAGGEYVVVSQKCGAVDLSRESDRNREGVHTGFATLEDAIQFIVIKVTSDRIEALEQKKGGGQNLIPYTMSEKVKMKGFTIWFTGLSGSGKTTIAELLYDKLRQEGYKVEILDGDTVRRNLSKGLGFNKEDRDENIKRIGFVCELLARNGVIAIAACISPYRQAREANRRRIGNFVEVYAKCPIEECIRRDPRGNYKKALTGEIKNYTGIDNPYEEPENPEIVIETDKERPEQSAQKILDKLKELHYLEKEKSYEFLA